MALSKEAKQISQVPVGFNCSLKAYQRLFDFIKPEYLQDYKDLDDECIYDMIGVESKLGRKRY